MRTISWFSCGAASAVATKLAIADHGQITIAYCEVIEEHPDNSRFLKDCEKWFGQPITILGNDKYKRSIYEVFDKTRYLAGHAGARCTLELKKNVRKSFELPTDRQVFGYTVEEQNRVDRFIDANNEVEIIAPLIDRGLTKADCLAMIEDAGIELPAMYKLGYKNNNCFSGETRFITRSGIRSFDDACGETVDILNRSGWQRAKVSYFGDQEIVEVDMSNGIRTKTIQTTTGHRWILPKHNNVSHGTIEKTTSELSEGDRPLINYTKPAADISREGVQHGFVFGDGTLHRTTKQEPYCSAYISECKEEILPWFDRGMCKSRNINGLSATLKELPKTTDHAYLHGFIAGLIAADGHVSKSGVSISNKDSTVINRLVEICQTIGMVCYRRKERVRDTNYKKQAKLSELIIPRGCLTDETIIRTFHKTKMLNVTTRPKSWRVDRVVKTGITKPVYCVTVEGDAEFTLEDNVLTGNCRGCVKAQSPAYWKKIQIDFPEYFEAMSAQEKRLGVKICKATIDGVSDVRMSLTDLPEHIKPKDDTVDIQCGIFCHMAQEEYK